eukprot:SM000060S19609  [mRNA]  locus=s60:175313:175771:+ [translate_table: standard]
MQLKKRGADYEHFKAGLAKQLLAALLRHFPQLAGNVESAELGTPLTNEHYLAAPGGGAYGLASPPARFSAAAAAAAAPRTPLRGLVLAGQDVALPGITGGLIGGAMAAFAVAPTRVGLGLLHEARRQRLEATMAAAAAAELLAKAKAKAKAN